MKNKQKLKLIQILIGRSCKDSKNFSYDLSLQSNKINGLNENLKINLTDHNSNQYRIGPSVVVGEIEGVENFVLFGVRGGETSFMLDMVDLEKNVVYDLYIIDDFIAIDTCKKIVEIDEKQTMTSSNLKFVLKKYNKKENFGVNQKCIDRFEDKVLNYDKCKEFFRKHLITLLSSNEYMKDITTSMENELRAMEIKVYVSIIYDYFYKNSNINTNQYFEDNKTAKEYNRIRRKGIDRAYQFFTKYPSEVYLVYDKIKENYSKDSVFHEFCDMTDIIK